MEEQEGEHYADILSDSSSEAWDIPNDQFDDDFGVDPMMVSSEDELFVGLSTAKRPRARRPRVVDNERARTVEDTSVDGLDIPPIPNRQPAAARGARGQARARATRRGRANVRRPRRPQPADFRAGWEEANNFEPFHVSITTSMINIYFCLLAGSHCLHVLYSFVLDMRKWQ